MGYVDTLTRFTHYNSYRLDPGEELFGTPFDVEFFSAINSQAQVICKGATSEGAMYMTWLAEDGSKLSRDEYEFDVTGRWVRQIWPSEPPEHAVRAMWSVKNTDDTEAWNVACAMTSAGEMAGAFDPALANQVSLLTASGLYTGTVTADQVVTGLLQATDGRAYFDLDKPEIVMQGDNAKWKASPENPLRLEDSDGNLIGGLVQAGDSVAFMTSVLGGRGQLKGFVQIGGREIIIDGSTKEVEGMILHRQDGEPAGYFAIKDDTMVIGKADYSIPAFSESDAQIIINGSDRDTAVMAGNLNGLFISSDDPAFPAIKRVRIVSANSVEVRNVPGTHALGVDNTGPYRIKNGTKTYF